MTDVKICGIKTANMLNTALEAGADYIGLVFFEKSPRNVSLEQAASLAEQMRGRAKSVALTVDASDALLAQISEHVRPDMLQLHGSESPQRVAEIKTLTGLPVIKAVKVSQQDDARSAKLFVPTADLVLFDAKAPVSVSAQEQALPGGNGVAFDWELLSAAPQGLPFMLSGGLDPENVVEAVSRTGAAAVDVSSGVERRPGEKDAGLIRLFIQRAKRQM